jgi:Undecaprenyl-phosphate glucose phosphotransferase
MLKRHHELIRTLFKASDIATAAAAWIAAYGLRQLAGQMKLTPHKLPEFSTFISPMLLSLVLMLLVFTRQGLYEPKRTKKLLAEIRDISHAIFVTWGLTYLIATFMKLDLSRIMMFSVLLSWLILAFFGRLLTSKALWWFRSRGLNIRHAAIIGTGRLGQTLFHRLKKNKWIGIAPRYFIGDSSKRTTLLDIDIRGPLDNIDEILSQQPVDIVFVALASDDQNKTEAIVRKLTAANVDVRLVPNLLPFHFLHHDVTQLDSMTIITLTHSPHQGWNSFVKRVFDLVISSFLIALFALPMLIIALTIKFTSKGPVFYRQERSSLIGKPFKILKFRTMIPNAEAETGATWTEQNDPRVTAFGKHLRKTSLDELPQLFNVFLGAMSMVGPRPERPELIERFRKQIPGYMLRHQVKAGLTGWAQVHGFRGQTSLRKRIQYDLYYITNWSLLLDLWTLILTPFRGLFNTNAY